MHRTFKHIFFIIFGLVAIGFSVVIFFVSNNDRFKCTYKTTAQIVDIMESDTHSYKASRTDKVFTPVFEYEYNGEYYRSFCNVYTGYNSSWLGKQVTLMINPDDPGIVYYADLYRTSFIVCIVSLVIGVIVLLRGIIVGEL